jgi:hypothetical protein
MRALFKGLYLTSKPKIRLVVWAISIAYVSVPIALVDRVPELIPPLAAIALGFLFFFVVEWALSRHYAEEYKTYAISGNLFSRTRILLHYALFVGSLEESQLSTEDLRKVQRWFESAEPPAKQESFLRHPLVTSILALLAVLAAEIVKNTEAWKSGQGIYWLIMMAALLLVASGVFGLFRYGRDAESKLNQFVTWYILSKEKADEV